MDKSAKLNFIFDFDWTIVMHKRFEEIIKYSVNYDSKKIDEYPSAPLFTLYSKYDFKKL